MTQSVRQPRLAKDEKVSLLARWLLPSIGGLSAFLVLQLLITNSWRFLLDSDTGWHVRTGELILQMRSVPRNDPFSHTMFGERWFAWEWLTETLMAALHGWRGLAGVVGGAIFVLLISYSALFGLMVRRGSDPLIACVITVFGAMAGIVGWLARPHLISIALMIVWYAMVESFRRRRSRWIYAVPLLIVLWANMHGAFVVTLVVLGVYAVGEFLELAARGQWRSNEAQKVLKTYLVIELLSALAVAVTPYGFELYGHLWRYLTDTPLLSTIQEFQSPDFHSMNGKLIEILLLLGVIAAVNALRQGRFVETGLLLFWGHMTLQSERHVTLAVVILSPIVAEQISTLIAEFIGRAAQGRETHSKVLRAARDWYRSVMAINRQLTGASCYIVALGFVIAATSTGLADKLLSPRFDDKRFPVAAADFVLQTNLPGNMFSHDQFGGYLIYRLYPKVKVFVDGRSDFYRQSTVLDEVDKIKFVKSDWNKLLNKRSVEWMLLKRDEPLAQIAVLSGKWVNIYEDSTSQILIRQASTLQTMPPKTSSQGSFNRSVESGRATPALAVIR